MYIIIIIIMEIKSRMIRCMGHEPCTMQVKNAYILFRKPEVKTPLRPRHIWENIRMDLSETGQKGVD
jgi:hypothetical protein